MKMAISIIHGLDFKETESRVPAHNINDLMEFRVALLNWILVINFLMIIIKYVEVNFYSH